jgi:hypothetical protein
MCVWLLEQGLTPNPERNKQMTIKELKKLIVQYKAEAEAQIPQLNKDAEDVGSCWQSEKLGHAKGYAQALKEILSKI